MPPAPPSAPAPTAAVALPLPRPPTGPCPLPRFPGGPCPSAAASPPAGPCSLPAAMPLSTGLLPPAAVLSRAGRSPSVTPSGTSTSLAPSGLFAATFLGRAPSASAPAALVALPPPCPPRLQARRRRRPQWSFRCHVLRWDLAPAVTPPRRALSFRCRLALSGTLVLREHDVSRETLHASGRILSIRAPASAERPSRRALRANSPSRRGDHRRCRSNGLSHG